MKNASSTDSLMETRVSPATTVVVLVLVTAILVALYFTVMAKVPGQGTERPASIAVEGARAMPAAEPLPAESAASPAPPAPDDASALAVPADGAAAAPRTNAPEPIPSTAL